MSLGGEALRQRIAEVLANDATRRPILYAIFGCVSASLDLLLFTALTEAGLLGIRPANILSVGCGILLSFLLNRAYSFGVRDRPLRRFLAFLGVGLFGLLVSDLVIALLVDRAGLWPPAAKLLSIPLVFVIQYNLNRLISFRRAGRA